MGNYDALKMDAVEEVKMNEQESIEYLTKFAADQKKSLDNMSDTVDDIQRITNNIMALTDEMSLTMWKLEVLVNPLLLKDIYNMGHAEWMALTPDNIIDLVEAIVTCPEKDTDEKR